MTPEQAALLPADESGNVLIALTFNLADLPEMAGVVIESAALNYEMPGMPELTRSDYYLYPILRSWQGPGSPGTAAVTEAVSAGAADTWRFYPRDLEAIGEGLVHFDMTSIVAYWEAGNLNAGVLLKANDVDRDALVDGLSGIVLTIGYGSPSN